MGKQTAQGTRWETQSVVDLEEAADRLEVPVVARRRAKAGQKHEADVEAIYGGGTDRIGVVAWHRLVKKDGNKVRVPDGERKVAVLAWDDFVKLVSHAADGHGSFQGTVYVQNKAAQQINATRTLAGLREWMEAWL